MQHLLAVDGDVFARTHFTPGHVTASAVVVSKERRAIALIAHTKLRKWLQPGGHVEPTDPDSIEAARREALEECGPLTLEPMGLLDVDVHDIPGFGAEPPHEHFDVRILFHHTAGDLATTGEVDDVGWFPLDRLPSPLGTSVARLAAKLGA